MHFNSQARTAARFPDYHPSTGSALRDAYFFIQPVPRDTHSFIQPMSQDTLSFIQPAPRDKISYNFLISQLCRRKPATRWSDSATTKSRNFYLPYIKIFSYLCSRTKTHENVKQKIDILYKKRMLLFLPLKLRNFHCLTRLKCNAHEKRGLILFVKQGNAKTSTANRKVHVLFMYNCKQY